MIRRTPLPARSSPPQRHKPLVRGAPPAPVNPSRSARRRQRYAAFIHSAAWRRIRAQKLAEAPTCELRYRGCLGDEQPTVHHTTYVRFGGKERMSDLLRACAPCHRYHDALAGRNA